MKISLTNGNDKLLFTTELDDSVLQSSVPITDGLIEQAGDTLKICFIQPILDIHGYWDSEFPHPQTEIPWILKLDSAAQREMPFLVWYNMAGINRASYGLTDLEDDAFLISQMSQSDAVFEIVWTIKLTPETKSFVFFTDRRPVPFPETVAAFRKRVFPKNPRFPKAAWNPVYNTWYAFHGAYTIPDLEKNAAVAKELGFRTFILDDGWSYDTSKRLNPATVSEWFSEIGKWTISEKKLPGFKEHVKRLQKMGFHYMLWCAPFLVGNQSKSYALLKQKNSILDESDDGSAVADPADSLVAEYIIPRILDTFREYDLDGLKIDFIDFVRPNEKKPRGRASMELVKTLIAEARKVRPDALIEFRQRYNTPIMLSYATNFRAYDVPFDFLENLHRCCQIRMVLGDGVPVHADPIAFHPRENSVNVARHMICALAGVPMLSADLTAMNPKHQAIVKRFLGFYQDHLETFRNGHWTIKYTLNHVASLVVETQDEVIATAVSEIPPMPAHKKFILLNMTSNEIRIAGRAEDCEGNPTKTLQPAGILFA